VSRFTTDGLYPSVAAPTFGQFGGSVPAGYSLSIVDPNAGSGGVIYYTLDGSDPRQLDDSPSPTAAAYAGPIALAESTTVRARILSGGQWSALVESFFTVESPLRVSEVHYNPAARTQAEIDAGVLDRDDFEFIEVVNTSASVAVNLNGVRFADGIEFTFGDVELAPGGRAVVAQNLAAFAVRYGDGIVPVGEYGGTIDNFRLSNAGEQITLVDSGGGVIHSFTYDDAWHVTTDGDGPSLVVVDELAAVDAWNDPSNWRASHANGGSPGSPDTPVRLAGDFNGDLVVGLADLAILQSHFGTASGATFAEGDANEDGAITAADAAILVLNYGASSTLPGGSAAAADAVLAQANLTAASRTARRPVPAVADARPAAQAASRRGRSMARLAVDSRYADSALRPSDRGHDVDLVATMLRARRRPRN
jgi:hypothetical protein